MSWTDTPCIEWPKGRHRAGYGEIRIKTKLYRMHRVAWENAYGPIPEGLSVLHRCDTPSCYNPLHLFVGTHRDNMQDMAAKGRHWASRRTHCNEGHLLSDNNLVRSALPKRRACRECSNRRSRESRARARERAAAGTS